MMSDDLKVSKDLGSPVVALLGVGHIPAKGEDEQEAARVFYVAATRATQRVVIGGGVVRTKYLVSGADAGPACQYIPPRT